MFPSKYLWVIVHGRQIIMLLLPMHLVQLKLWGIFFHKKTIYHENIPIYGINQESLINPYYIIILMNHSTCLLAQTYLKSVCLLVYLYVSGLLSHPGYFSRMLMYNALSLETTVQNLICEYCKHQWETNHGLHSHQRLCRKQGD